MIAEWLQLGALAWIVWEMRWCRKHVVSHGERIATLEGAAGAE